MERGEILKGFRNHAISETFDSRSTASFVGRLNVEKCAYIIQDTYIHAYIYTYTSAVRVYTAPRGINMAHYTHVKAASSSLSSSSLVVARTEVKFIASSYAWRAPPHPRRFATDVRARACARASSSPPARPPPVNTRVTCCLETSKCET